MKPIMFAEVWNSIWPHKPLGDNALRLVWGPDVARTDAAKAVDFLRGWAREHTWPPSLHEFLVGVGHIAPPKPSQAREQEYTCEYCGTQVSGYPKFAKHLEDEHEQELASTDEVKEIIKTWKKEHPQPPKPQQEAEDDAEGGDAEDGEETAEVGNAENGTDIPPSADGDPQAAWELASRNLRDHDGRKQKGRSCTLCDDLAPGLLFRQSPVDVVAIKVVQGVTIIAANCWGCESLGKKNYFGMPTPSESTRRAGVWKRMSNMTGTKGMRKAQRANWINTALSATRRLLEHRAKGNAQVPPPPHDAGGEPEICATCGDPKTGARLLFGSENGGPILAALCPDCGGSPMYAAASTPDRPPLEVASGGHWKRYDEVFEAKFDRPQMVAAAVRRTRERLLAAQGPQGDPPSEPSEGAPEAELDEELPI